MTKEGINQVKEWITKHLDNQVLQTRDGCSYCWVNKEELCRFIEEDLKH